MTRLLATLTLAAAALAAAAGGAQGNGEAPHLVRCGEIIDHTAFPFLGRPGVGSRYRTVLGAVSAPPARLEVSHHPDAGRFPYFAKSGLVVREQREPVTVTLPRAWRDRVRIAWGNGNGLHTSLRILGCGSNRARARVYAGGFALRGPSACVPLVFESGGRSATLRFGVGQLCP